MLLYKLVYYAERYSMDIKKNDNIKLDIESLTSEGSAVGHYNGVAVFVRGAVTGDEIEAHIIKTSKRFCIAKVNEIITPSPYRIESDCEYSKSCGGCSFRNVSYDEELRYKRSRVEDAFKRIAHLDIKVNETVTAIATRRSTPYALKTASFLPDFTHIRAIGLFRPTTASSSPTNSPPASTRLKNGQRLRA